jgi:hypothetical protein
MKANFTDIFKQKSRRAFQPTTLVIGVRMSVMMPVLLLSALVFQQNALANGPESFPSLFPADSLTIRLNQDLNSGKNQAGTRFHGVVETAVSSNGKEIVPKGASVEGYIREASTSGRVSGRSELHLHLDSLTIHGKRYSITTQPEIRTGPGHAKRNAVLVGGGAALGTVVGALAGGGKGAAVGMVTGAAAGGAGAVVTGKKEILIPAESVITFRLRDRVVLD